MAFKHNRFSILLATNPEAAHKQLCSLIAKHKTVDAVAKHLGVDRHTIPRWIKTLISAGYTDPRLPETTS